MTGNTLLIDNCTLLPEQSSALQHDCYIVIAEGTIKKIGFSGERPDLPFAVRRIDAGGKLALPGLINAHNHCAMTLFRGLADDLDLNSWLHNHIFPAEAAHVNSEMVYWCTKLAAAEMILSGTTTVADGYFFSDAAAQALHDSGMRAVVAHGIVDFTAPSVPDPRKNIEAVEHFIAKWHSRSKLITPAVFAHAPYTCSPKTLMKAKTLADKNNVRFFTHIAESKNEQQMIIDPQGSSPIRHLAALGLIDTNCSCVHAIWLDDEDMDLLAESGAGVITCPQSNLKLASGIARIQDMLNQNILVGLGTDGAASNNSLDMFREMDMLAKIQKSATGRATAMTASDVMRIATTDGAATLGLTNCGELKTEARADIILMNTSSAHLSPFYNRDLLVYGAVGSDVDTAIIDGELVMEDRKIRSFDLDEVYREINKRKIEP